MEDIALANLIESLQKQTDEEIFPKSIEIIAVLYIMKRKIKKIFFEVISNSKISNIDFFQRNGQRPRFSQTYRGGTGQRRIRELVTIFFRLKSNRKYLGCYEQKICNKKIYKYK